MLLLIEAGATRFFFLDLLPLLLALMHIVTAYMHLQRDWTGQDFDGMSFLSFIFFIGVVEILRLNLAFVLAKVISII